MFRATLASTLANLTSYAAADAEVLLFLDTLPVYVDLAGSEEDTNGTMSFFSMQSQWVYTTLHTSGGFGAG